jgi:hypothetical protein
MNKTVQILLLFAVLVPLTGTAREETLEERKRRITRKYMHENAALTESELVVPENQRREENQILDSERFKEAEVDFARQEGGATMPMPRRPRPMPRTQNSNWLLAEDPMAEVDPYGSTTDLEKPERPEDYWKSWGSDREEEPAATDWRSSNRYGQQDPSRSDSRQQGFTDPRDPRANQADVNQQGSTLTGGLFNRQPQQQDPRSGVLGLTRQPTYGTSPESGLLKRPFQRKESGTTDRSFGGDPNRQGYTPRQSPYQTQRETPTTRQMGVLNEPKKKEYQRTDPYKKWKDDNKSWDPTKDDAYLDDVMRQNRR